MKNKIIRIMAVVLTAIFVFGTVSVSAAPSPVKCNKDYRNMDILNRQGVKVNKPTAQFAANRVVNGEVVDMAISYEDYNCNTEFPTLVCYVGDTLTFTDMSRENNGGEIVEWDWQRFGALGDKYELYSRNIVNEEKYILTQPGETTFYLCVKSDTKVKTGCCDPWSENGNHQVIGKNKWFPNGAYWYFTAIRVVVKPKRDAIVHVRLWDAQNNRIFHEGTVNAGQILEDSQTVDTSVYITDWEGYKYMGWNVQLMDGTIQYSGVDRDVGITLAGWVPEKYLNIEYIPYVQTDVEVRYWNKAENTLMFSEMFIGEPVVGEMETTLSVQIKEPEDYKVDGWNVQLMDGTIQYEGAEDTAVITFNTYLPKKILNVKCYPITKAVIINYIDSKDEKIIKTATIRPEQVGVSDVETEIELENIPGYVTRSWALKGAGDVLEKTGTEHLVSVTLTQDVPRKTLCVYCDPIDGGNGGGSQDQVPPPSIDIEPDGACDGVIKWTETDSHRVITGYRRNEPVYGWCNHKFEYQSVLGATAQITPDTFKSGYGFELDVDCTVNTTLVRNTGCNNWGNNRNPSAAVKNPTTATIFVPWDMSNRLGSQGRTIAMIPNGTLKFTLPSSPVSEIGAKKIYTPVELAGTTEEPKSHSFEIYIGGGGVDSVEFCQKLTGTITINGDMYEDDFSGSN